MLKNSFLFVLVAAFLGTCKPSKPELPQTCPADFKLNYHLDGGMNDYSVDIVIKSDSCYYNKRQEGKVVKKEMKLSPLEMKQVYELVKTNDFDKIESLAEKGIVYDRGGESIRVDWDKNSITVSNAQSNFVKEKWYEKWKMLCEGLDGFAAGKVK